MDRFFQGKQMKKMENYYILSGKLSSVIGIMSSHVLSPIINITVVFGAI